MMKTWNDAIAVLKNKRDALYLSGYIEKRRNNIKRGKRMQGKEYVYYLMKIHLGKLMI